MPLLDYASYQAGVMPSADVTAQKRCLDYLKATVAALNQKVASTSESMDDGKLARSQLRTLRSIEDIIGPFAGSIWWRSAEKFWHGWDRNKEQIISTHDHTHNREKILTAIGELEDGRYYND